MDTWHILSLHVVELMRKIETMEIQGTRRDGNGEIVREPASDLAPVRQEETIDTATTTGDSEHRRTDA